MSTWSDLHRLSHLNQSKRCMSSKGLLYLTRCSYNSSGRKSTLWSAAYECVHYCVVSCALAFDRKLSAGTSISSISLKLQPRNCQTRAVMKSLFLWSMRPVSLRSAVCAICADESYAGGGIIDMMNTRLQNRLTESEILKIFSDTVEVCLSFAPSLLS